MLVLGPSRSGKTSSLIVPNVLAANGAVVTTSTKPDVMHQTAAARARTGRVLLYDPSGTVEAPPEVERVGWSPIAGSATWDGAVVMAETMAGAARTVEGGGRSPAEDHWSERAMALLAPLLHAASRAGESMATVQRWVDRREPSDALAVLGSSAGEHATPTNTLIGVVTTEARELSGIWSSAAGILAAYRSSGALASTDGPLLDPEELVAAGDTLYICAPGRRQQQLAPLVVGLLGDIRDAAYRRANTSLVGTGPPVLFALDELANIAPLPDLPALVSEGGGQGLVTLACLQDLSQARARWGRQAEGFLSLFGTTVVFGGVADVATLRALSAIAGEHEVPSRAVARSPGGVGRSRVSSTISGVLRPRLPVDVIARGRPEAVLALDARNRLGWISTTPAYRSSPWRELTASRARERPTPPERLSRGSPLPAERRLGHGPPG